MIDFSRVPDVRLAHPDFKSERELAFAAHMVAREEAYRAIFGETSPSNQILAPEDPKLWINWPGGGVFQYPPGRSRRGWHYVTHGLAQPFEPTMETEDDPAAISGWGIELVISTPRESHWAFDVLLNLVRYLLFQSDSRPILPHDRLPCNGPLVLGSNTKLNHLLACLSPEYENELRLPAGHCDLVHLVGVTEKEIRRAKQWGSGQGGSMILEEVLHRMGVGVLSDPDRNCLTSLTEFESVWTAVQDALENRWNTGK